MPSGRGRPRIGTNETKQSRQERGRLAQRAYRQRQVDELESHRERLKALKDTVRGFDTEVSRLVTTLRVMSELRLPVGDQEAVQRLSHGLRMAADTALQLLEPIETGNHNAVSGSPASTTTPLPSQTLIEASSNTSPLPSGSDDFSNLPLATPTELSSTRRTITSTEQTPHIQRSLELRASPPPDIMPYLHRGRETFAGALFWRSLEIAYSRLQEVASWGYNLAQALNMGSLTPAQVTFSISFRHDSAGNIRQRIGSRLRFRQSAETDPSDLMPEDDGASYLRQQVGNTLASSGQSLSQYLEPSDVESHVRRHCYVSTTAVFLRSPGGTAKTGAASLTPEQFLAALVEKLASQSICFGDGPRFTVDSVDSTLQKILSPA